MTDDQQGRLLAEIGFVFRPGSPIHKRSLFAGRTDELRRILDAVSSPGKHVILYGDKGVGKTSLVTILKELLAVSTHGQSFVSRVNCNPTDHYAGVWDKALAEVPIEKEGGKAHEHYHLNKWLDLKKHVGPNEIRKVLQTGNAYIPELVIVFDEFNVLAPEHRAKFAHTIKDLADSLTGATIILVGVADDITALIADHASIGRNLAQIKMEPMSRAEVRELLDKGLKQLDMKMQAEPCETIVTLAQGYPHYAHLLAKHAALSAAMNRRFDILSGDVTFAIREALKDVGYNIPDLYHKATLAQRKGTLFESVLIACAMANVDEMGYFSSTDVKPALFAVAGKHYEIYGFSQHLEKFASEQHRGPVLEKRGTGRCFRYRFLEPLLRPYAIIKGMADGVVTVEMLQQLNNQSTRKKAATRTPRNVPAPKQTLSGPGLFDNL